MTGDVWTPPAARPDVLSALTEEERYARFDVLQSRMSHVWDAMRLNYADESVVVVPSITLDRAVASSGSLTQAYEERFLFLLVLLRQPRLQMIYVTSMPIAPEIIEYYLALLPGCHPESRQGAPVPRVGQRLVATLAQREAAGPAETARPDRGLDPQPVAITSAPLQHDRAGAGRRAQLSASRCTALIRASPISGRRQAADGSSPRCGVPYPLGAEDLHSLDEIVDALIAMRAQRPGMRQRHRQAQRRRLRGRQRCRAHGRAAGAGSCR